MNTPAFILVAGPPGSGKSTLGTALAKRLGACFVDLDTVASPFVQPLLDDDPAYKDSSAYQEVFRDREYRATLSVAAENVAIGCSCVCVAPFRRETQEVALRQRLHELVGHRCRTVGVTLLISAEELHRNLSQRNLARDRRKLDDFDSFARTTLGAYRAPLWNVDVMVSVAFSRTPKWTHEAAEQVVSALTAEWGLSDDETCRTSRAASME